jgi:hypothetical protein
VSKDFAKEVLKLSEAGIPATIVQVLVKLHACRGSASGAAHANVTGGFKVGSLEAELILSLSAAVITYNKTGVACRRTAASPFRTTPCLPPRSDGFSGSPLFHHYPCCVAQASLVLLTAGGSW